MSQLSMQLSQIYDTIKQGKTTTIQNMQQQQTYQNKQFNQMLDISSEQNQASQSDYIQQSPLPPSMKQCISKQLRFNNNTINKRIINDKYLKVMDNLDEIDLRRRQQSMEERFKQKQVQKKINQVLQNMQTNLFLASENNKQNEHNNDQQLYSSKNSNSQLNENCLQTNQVQGSQQVLNDAFSNTKSYQNQNEASYMQKQKQKHIRAFNKTIPKQIISFINVVEEDKDYQLNHQFIQHQKDNEKIIQQQMVSQLKTYLRSVEQIRQNQCTQQFMQHIQRIQQQQSVINTFQQAKPQSKPHYNQQHLMMQQNSNLPELPGILVQNDVCNALDEQSYEQRNCDEFQQTTQKLPKSIFHLIQTYEPQCAELQCADNTIKYSTSSNQFQHSVSNQTEGEDNTNRSSIQQADNDQANLLTQQSQLHSIFDLRCTQINEETKVNCGQEDIHLTEQDFIDNSDLASGMQQYKQYQTHPQNIIRKKCFHECIQKLKQLKYAAHDLKLNQKVFCTVIVIAMALALAILFLSV